MIDFRYHVVSIVAIFLALASGIVLGAGPLKGAIDQQLVRAAEEDREDKELLRTQLDRAAEQDDFQNAYARATSSLLLQNRLEGRSVALVLLPGADPDIADGVAEDVASAGGSITGRVQLEPDLLDPENRQFAEGLAAQVLEKVEEVPPTEGASSYELVGYSLARWFLTAQPEGAPVDTDAQTIASSYEGYVTADGDVERRAGLAVVVAADPAESKTGQPELVTTLVQALDTASGGVVVAGGAVETTDGGYLEAIRESDAAETVSTVNVAHTAAGQVVTVLALVEQAGGRAGQYGLDAADGPMPDLSAS